MDLIPIIFACLGILVGFVGGIMLLIAAFRENVWWGLACLFVPLAGLVFVFMHWEVARRGFLLNLFGTLIAVGAIFSSPKTRADVAKSASEMKLPMVEKEKPKDLNVLIEVKRAEIDKWEAEFREQGGVVAQQYQSLQARLATLQKDNPVEVESFNAAAAAYQQSNNALKLRRQEIDAAQHELTNLLDERSRQKAAPGGGGAAARPVSIPAAVPSAPASARTAAAGAVVIYTTSRCGWCDRAKEYFAKKGVRYEERDVEKSDSARQEFKRLGGKGVPLITVGTETIKGFNQQRLDQLL